MLRIFRDFDEFLVLLIQEYIGIISKFAFLGYIKML